MKKALTTIGMLLLLLTISYTTTKRHEEPPVPLEVKELPVESIDSIWPSSLPQKVWPLPYYDAIPLKDKQFVA